MKISNNIFFPIMTHPHPMFSSANIVFRLLRITLNIGGAITKALKNLTQYWITHIIQNLFQDKQIPLKR